MLFPKSGAKGGKAMALGLVRGVTWSKRNSLVPLVREPQFFRHSGLQFPMGSLFINAGLAAGVGLVALPVILHLFFRQTPKRVIFPALQLVRERQKRSRKKLKVKNWLLLLARMALLALMALALARPMLYSQTSLGDQEVPTA